MSYSLEHRCGDCILEPECLDKVFLESAVNGIHQANYSIRAGFSQRAHKGGGIVRLDCQNFTAAAKGIVPSPA